MSVSYCVRNASGRCIKFRGRLLYLIDDLDGEMAQSMMLYQRSDDLTYVAVRQIRTENQKLIQRFGLFGHLHGAAMWFGTSPMAKVMRELMGVPVEDGRVITTVVGSRSENGHRTAFEGPRLAPLVRVTKTAATLE